MKLEKKQELKQKRRWRIRKKVQGTSGSPRLAVSFSNKHIYAQCIDDEAGKTIIFVSTLSKDLKGQNLKPNVTHSVDFGKHFAQKAKAAGINNIVFDRTGRRYHGCVKAFADAVRAEGVSF